MGKHSKNNCALPYYTNAERAKDASRQGYGTRSPRISKDSVKDFDACWITLSPCRDPVITPYGHLYEKEAIYEYIVTQKADIARRTRAYDEEVARDRRQQEAERANSERRAVQDFEKMESSVSAGSSAPAVKADGKPRTIEDVRIQWDAKETKLTRNFWIPAMTPEAKPEKVEKPDPNVYCPTSGKRLKIKDLIPVKFTPVDKSKTLEETLVAKERWICPITLTVLTNGTPCAVLRPSGSVVTMDAVNNVIRKDMVDPFTGTPMTEADIIPILRGGTGFAASGNDLKPTKYTPALQAS